MDLDHSYLSQLVRPCHSYERHPEHAFLGGACWNTVCPSTTRGPARLCNLPNRVDEVVPQKKHQDASDEGNEKGGTPGNRNSGGPLAPALLDTAVLTWARFLVGATSTELSDSEPACSSSDLKLAAAPGARFRLTTVRPDLIRLTAVS